MYNARSDSNKEPTKTRVKAKSMVKKKTDIDLKLLAKELKTKVIKTDKGVGEFVRYRFKHFKGIVHSDTSGGMTLKVPGLDCFISHGTIETQIEEIEKIIAAYKAIEPELKQLKRAVKTSRPKMPVKPKPHTPKK